LLFIEIAASFSSPCAAWVWKDDFSDPTLRDWGESFKSDECIVHVRDECFNFKGLQNRAQFRTKNWALGEIRDYLLEVEWKVKQIDFQRGKWGIEYEACDVEEKNGTKHWTSKGVMFFGFSYIFDIAGFNVVILSYLPGELQAEILARAHFELEKGLWYSFKLEVAGNRYRFSVDDEVIADIEDNTVPAGWLGFQLSGMIDVYFDNFTVTGPYVFDSGPRIEVAEPMETLSTTWGELKSE